MNIYYVPEYILLHDSEGPFLFDERAFDTAANAVQSVNKRLADIPKLLATHGYTDTSDDYIRGVYFGGNDFIAAEIEKAVREWHRATNSPRAKVTIDREVQEAIADIPVAMLEELTAIRTFVHEELKAACPDIQAEDYTVKKGKISIGDGFITKCRQFFTRRITADMENAKNDLTRIAAELQAISTKGIDVFDKSLPNIIDPSRPILEPSAPAIIARAENMTDVDMYLLILHRMGLK